MTMKISLLVVLISMAITGCSRSGDPSPALQLPSTSASAASQAARASSDSAAMSIDALAVTVHKNDSCSCCSAWVTYLRRNGFEVREHDVDNLSPIKERLGIPYGKGSCHTAEVAGYFIEGHVPASDIRRLLTERPDAKGLTVPGMPAGSPGMETPDGTVQPYDVFLVARDGSTSVFSHHGN